MVNTTNSEHGKGSAEGQPMLKLRYLLSKLQWSRQWRCGKLPTHVNTKEIIRKKRRRAPATKKNNRAERGARPLTAAWLCPNPRQGNDDKSIRIQKPLVPFFLPIPQALGIDPYAVKAPTRSDSFESRRLRTSLVAFLVSTSTTRRIIGCRLYATGEQFIPARKALQRRILTMIIYHQLSERALPGRVILRWYVLSEMPKLTRKTMAIRNGVFTLIRERLVSYLRSGFALLHQGSLIGCGLHSYNLLCVVL